MKILKQSWEFEENVNGNEILKKIEKAGRKCYKSENKITDNSAAEFIKRIISLGHHAVIEHHNVTVGIITDRGVSHEIVRHRIASYNQESTRYCNYSNNKFSNEITVILPVWFYDSVNNEELNDISISKNEQFKEWAKAMLIAEENYINFIQQHEWTPQEARSVLPNSLKTELSMTCNLREWRHFFNLRCSNAAHPQLRELARDMLKGFHEAIPVVFNDLANSFLNERKC